MLRNFIIFCYFIFQANANYSGIKHWIATCYINDCHLALKPCSPCFSINSCKLCITSIRPDCSRCADDIFKTENLDIINGSSYLICDSNDKIQIEICHMFCRGNSYDKGQCRREENFSACQCSNNPITTTTTTTSTTTTSTTTTSTTTTSTTTTSTTTTITTTTLRRTTTLPPGNYFFGNLKLKIPIYDGFQKIFPLPNGDFIRGSSWSDSRIELWDSQRGIIKRVLRSAYQNPNHFGLLSNGYLISSHPVNKTLLLWDLTITDNESLKKIIHTDEIFMCLTVLKNDDIALGQSGLNFDIVIRNGLTGLVKRRLIGHTSTVYQIKRFQSDRLVSCSSDNTVKIWNELNGSLLGTLTHSSSVYSIEILQNGYLAAGLNENSIYIWDINTSNLIRILRGHDNIICNYECLFQMFNGDLLSGSYDSTLKLWNPFDGYLKLTVSKHTSAVRQLVVTYSKNIISVSANEIIIWN